MQHMTNFLAGGFRDKHSFISAHIANTTYQNVSILLMQHNKISTQLDYGKITTLECMNVLHLSPCYEPTWVI